MERMWLWLVIIGLILTLLGAYGLLSGKTPGWYLLLGLVNLIAGINLMLRQKSD